MGWIEKVKGIICGLKAFGKSEKEIEQIVQQAADKATVGGRCKEVNYEKIWIDGIPYKVAVPKRCETRTESNNWRKMHGLPMRRKRRVRR